MDRGTKETEANEGEVEDGGVKVVGCIEVD